MYAHSGGRSRAPLTHTAGVDVEEAGLRVEADAAGLPREGRLVQRLKVALGPAGVGRLALPMQRALGDAIAVVGKAGVGLWRAVAGAQLDGLLAGLPPAQRAEQVEELATPTPAL